MCCFLIHWGRVTYFCVSKLAFIGSDNGLLPGWRQAIIWTNRALGSKLQSNLNIFSFKKMHLKLSSGKWQSFCLGLNVLNTSYFIQASVAGNSGCCTKTVLQHRQLYLQPTILLALVLICELNWPASVQAFTADCTTCRHWGPIR